MDESALPARLLLLLDSRSPAGGHGHSSGLEAAVNVGLVRSVPDVEAFCRGRLATSGRVMAAFAAMSALLWAAAASADTWLALDDELSARTPSPAQRSASRALGNGLRRLVLASAPDADLRAPWVAIASPAPHHALVLGAACAIAGGGPVVAARAAALTTCTAPASAAVRLLGLDPYAVQAVLSALGDEVDRTGDEATRIAEKHWPTRDFDQLPADSAPGMELLADVHARSEVRLFAS